MRQRLRRLLGQNGTLLPVGNRITSCWEPLQILTDGWYGYDSSQVPTGILIPPTTSDGSIIYAYKFNINTGEFRLQFGESGITQLDNCILIIFRYKQDNVEMYWDNVNEYYTGVNQALADALALLTGTEVCGSNQAIPEVLIDIDYSEMEVEV